MLTNFTRFLYLTVEVGIICHHPGNHFARQGVFRKPAQIDNNARFDAFEGNLMVEKSSKIGGVSFTS